MGCGDGLRWPDGSAKRKEVRKEVQKEKNPDLTGQKFGQLTAISPTGRYGYSGEYWLCVCACGNLKEIMSYDLRSGRVKTCGHAQNQHRDYTGVRRGDLIGVRKTGKTVEHRGKPQPVWEWCCKCGRIIEKAVFEVAPGGVSCCPECAKEKKKRNARLANLKNRVEGTNMTEAQLRGVLEGRLTQRNRSGIRGVSWAKNANKWTARGFKDGKAVHLGYFEKIEDAARARQEFLNKNLNVPDDFK